VTRNVTWLSPAACDPGKRAADMPWALEATGTPMRVLVTEDDEVDLQDRNASSRLLVQIGAASAVIEAVISAVGSACGSSGVFSHSPSCHELRTTILQRS
jgi:hypothetical protein